MPIYEYHCPSCNQTFSLLQRVGASEADTACPRCGAARVSRLVSSFSSTSSGGTSASGSGCGPGAGSGFS